MKKILCDKDGKFLSVHEKNGTFVELKDGDYLTHEDGCILIYKEYECKENISEISYHVYLRNNKLHFPQTEMSFSYHDFIPSYRFSAEEEKKRMDNALAGKGLFYNTKSKCIEKIRWRAKKGYMYYYIDFNVPDSFCVASRTETFDYIDECRFNTHNYFRTEKEAEKELDSKTSSMIKKECYIWVGQIIEYRGMALRKVRPGKYVVISPCSLVSRPVYIDKGENLNVL